MQGHDKTAKLKTPAKGYIISFLIGFVGFALIYVALFNAVSPSQYTLAPGEIAQTTITATKAIQDEVTTQQNIDYARAQVETILKLDEAVEGEVAQGIQAVLDTVSQYRSRYRQDTILYKSSDMDIYYPSMSLCEDFAKALLPLSVTREQAGAMLMVTDGAFSSFGTIYLQLVSDTLEAGLREQDIASTKARLDRDIQSAYYNVNADMIPLGKAITAACLRANLFNDEEATEAAREEAAMQVEPVMYKKGQNVVVANEIVTEAQYDVVARLGLLKDDTIDFNLYIGLGVVVLLLFVQLGLYMVMFEDEVLRQPKLVSLIMAVFLLVILLSVFVRGIDIYLMPLQLGIFLLAALVNRRVALVCNASLAVLVGMLASGDEGLFASDMFNILLVAIISGSVAVYLTKHSNQRISVLYSGLLVTAMNFAAMFGIGLMTMSNTVESLVSAAYFAGGGAISAMLAMGFTPLFEVVFSIVTPQKLMELSNPNHPLLRKLQTETPGTYHHSLIVANLAEAAAQSIGANELLARVGAYYHDVGKTKRPLMFKENQIGGENPHDMMDPYVSAAIITAHTRDGAIMAQKYKLPKLIENIIRQHHGKTTAAYFYYIALKRAEETGAAVDVADFTYDGPKPDSKEAAIIFLADTVEAATRSLKKHTAEDIEKLVRKLTKGRIQDGQLSDAPLTLAEIETVVRSFINSLMGFYHDRIEYPEINPPKDEAAALGAAQGAQEAAPQAQEAAAEGPEAVKEGAGDAGRGDI